MPAEHLDQLIEQLLSDGMGRIFVSNVLNHIEVKHLDARIFRAAWQYAVDTTTAIPRDARGVIDLIESWPGTPGIVYARQPCRLQGRQRPVELQQWETQILVHVCKTEYLNSRKHDALRLGGSLLVLPNPIMPNRFFLLWCVLPQSLPTDVTADRARDLLGLVHHTKEKRVELALISFSPGTVRYVARPTALDGGASSRFFAVSEREWDDRLNKSDPTWMGFTADLDRIRQENFPIAASAEGVAPADNVLISDRATERVLGLVTLPAVGDTRKDRIYERYVRRGRTKKKMRSFLRHNYRSRP